VGGVIYSRKIKMRLRYAKTGDLRLLSQLEVMTTFARAFRRASIPTLFSEGFHPHPKVSFGPAMAVGLESICEYMDAELSNPLPPSLFKDSINKYLPDGLEVMRVKDIPYITPSLNSFITHYAYEIRFDETILSAPPLNPLPQGEGKGDLWTERVTEKDSRKIRRMINTSPFIEEIKWLKKDILFLMLKSIGGECCRPADVVKALFGVSPEDPAVRIRRVGLYGNTGGILILPDGLTNEMEKLCLLK
jgi:radical SAM-linked protein